jgi:hypothetical protein
MVTPSTSPTFVGDAELRRHADRRQRILDIVPAGHRHFDPGDGSDRAATLANGDVEAVASRKRHDILASYVGKRRKAVGDDPPVAKARDDRLHF